MEEKALIRACIRGDHRAWDIFLELYSNLIYSTIDRTLSRNEGGGNARSIREDIYNLVLLKLIEDDYKRLRKYRGGKENYSFAPWLRVVTTNITVDVLRKQRRAVLLNGCDEPYSFFQGISDSKGFSHNPEKVATERETLSRVIQALKELKPKERLIMELLYIKELPKDRVADIMQTSQGNINTIVHRIRNKIRKVLPDI